MSFCRECGADLPEGGRFCTRCGTPAAEVAPPTSRTPPRVARPGAAGTGPALAPRTPKAPPSESEDAPDLEDTPDLDAALAERYLKQPVPEGTVVCRFCKGPLDLTGTYCEQCGAPLEEAAPPGLKPQPPAVPATTVELPNAPQAAAVQPPRPPAVSPEPSTPPPVPPPAPMVPPSVVAARPAPTWGASEATVSLKESPVQTRLPERFDAPVEEAAPTRIIKTQPQPAATLVTTVRFPQAPQGAAVQPPAVPKPPAVPAEPSTPPSVPPQAPIAPTSVVAAPPTPTSGASEATVLLRESPIQPAPPGKFDAPPAAPTIAAAQPAAALPPQTAEPPLPVLEPWQAPEVAPAAAPGVAQTLPEAPPRGPLFAEETAVLLAWAHALGRKSSRIALVGIAAGVVVVAGGVATWYLLRSHPVVQAPPQRAAAPAPATTAPPPAEIVPVPAPVPESSAPVETSKPAAPAPATSQRKKVRVAKPATLPAPAAPAPSPRAQEIASLQNQARDAYAKGNYVEPVATNSIALSKQVLALDPANSYAKTLLEDSANGGKYQVQQAIVQKDFVAAHRVADALAQLLPGRRDIAGLKEDIASAERADAEARRPKPAAPLVAFRAYHMHSEKAPADHGPYCLGMLSVAAGHLKFLGQSGSEGQRIDTLDIACSEVREIKKNARVASRQNGFHVRTASTNINFVPENSIAAYVSALAFACTK